MRNTFWGLISLLLFLSSCIDPIAFQVDRGQKSGLVINGKLIYGQPTFVNVTVDRLFAFYAASRNRVPTCCISLENDLGQRIELKNEFLSTFSLEIPLHHSDFDVSLGYSFRIIIGTLDEGIFESAWEPLLPDSISLDQTTTRFYSERLGLQEFQSYELQVNTPLYTNGSDQPSRLLWSNEKYEIVHPNVVSCNEFNTIFIRLPVTFDGNTINADYLEGFPIVTSRVQDLNGLEIEDQLCLVLYQQSLSPTALAYWQQVIKLLERGDVDITRAALGQVTSNIRAMDAENETQAFGFFYATQQDTLFFTKEP